MESRKDGEYKKEMKRDGEETKGKKQFNRS